MKITLCLLTIALLGGGGVFGYYWNEDRVTWNTLLASVASSPPGGPATQDVDDWVLLRNAKAGDGPLTGEVRLANGEVWRFAFLSHHLLGGRDSKSVFDGPRGRFRVQGESFCCEVQFPDTAQPKDSDEFLALLKQTHPMVESIH